MNHFEATKDLLFDKIESYAKTTIDLAKLNAIDKTTDVVSALATKLAVILVVSMFVLFVNIGLSLWIGSMLNEYYLGFLIVSGFYLLVAILLYSFRTQLISEPISNIMLSKLLKNIDLDKILSENKK